ncbi:hypothetical protein [Parasitella parasitica]|uniref:Spindle pole body component n=1 Tax=Parasitella parasitica TaxID=35722 RepID=A0A0B7N1M9_9FUNG|nr:hypothetical protein [Parasitella parasitica]
MDQDSLLRQLVHKITDLQPYSPELENTVQKVKYILRYDKCTSTSEQEVANRIDGLAEKFSIKGHNRLSTALLKHREEFLKMSRPLGTEDSNLLLSLSSSSNQDFNYIPTIKDTEKEVLTWQDVIKDDPLEGDHWKKWPDETTDDDEEDDEEDDEDDGIIDDLELNCKTPTAAMQRRSHLGDLSNSQFDFTSKMKIDKRGDQEGLNHLMSQQYWRQEYHLPQQDSPIVNLLQKPCQMSDALEKIFDINAEKSQLKAISEANMTREVLLLLRGYRGVLYSYEDGQFVFNEQYIVQHLGQQALGRLLQEFSFFGNIVADLRKLATRAISEIKYGQTSQAFAATLFQSLMDFDSKLSEFEAKSSIITSDSSHIISLLNLRNTLDSPLQCFKAIHDVVVDAPYPQEDSRSISIYLIATLYDRALIAQSSGQQTMYDTLLYVLQKTVVPYGHIMDDWIFHGSLNGDKAKEFYVSRRDEVSMNDSNFWIDGFTIEPVDQNFTCYSCPLFDKSVMSRIFFTGKAVNLLSQIKKKKQIQHTDQTRTPFQSLFSDYVCVKPPFIKPVKMQDQQVSPVAEYDLLMSALFSLNANLAIRSQQQQQHREQDSTYDYGSLFDLDLMRCSEAYIEEPYNKAASTLNTTLHQSCGLNRQLESLASIYLMLENDLMHSFCEALYTQLDNNETWFDSRILNRTFTESSEVSGYDETVYIELESVDSTMSKLNNQASYLELIQFNVEIAWPLNNFIQQKHLPSYSKIQRFLFRLKRAKYVMEKKTMFRGKIKMAKSDPRAMRFYSIRMRILWFINAFFRYIMTTILHAETINFRDKLSMSKDADEITALHSSYIRRIVDRCLLNEKASSIKKSIVSILDMAEQMMSIFERYMQSTDSYTDQISAEDFQELDRIMDAIEKDFNRTNEFISVSLTILGKKGGFPWFESLAASLSAQ